MDFEAISRLDDCDSQEPAIKQGFRSLNVQVSEIVKLSIDQSTRLLENVSNVRKFSRVPNHKIYLMCIQRLINELLFDGVHSSFDYKIDSRLEQNGILNTNTSHAVLMFQRYCNSILRNLGVSERVAEDSLIGSQVIKALLSIRSRNPFDILLLHLGLNQSQLNSIYNSSNPQVIKYLENLRFDLSFSITHTDDLFVPSLTSSSVVAASQSSFSDDRIASGALAASSHSATSHSSEADEPELIQESLDHPILQQRVLAKLPGEQRAISIQVGELLSRIASFSAETEILINGRGFVKSQLEGLRDIESFSSDRLWSQIALEHGLEFTQEFTDTTRDRRFNFERKVSKYPKLREYYPFLRRLINEESGWNPRAQNGSGAVAAYGLAQIKATYYRDYLNYTSGENTGDLNMSRLLNPSYNLRVFLSITNRYIQILEGLDYAKQYPDRMGFLLYLFHHDGIGGMKWTLRYLREYPNVNESTYNRFKRRYRRKLPGSWNPSFSILQSVLNKAAIVNGDNLDSMFAPETVSDEYLRTRVQFFGDSIADGIESRLYSDGQSPTLDTTTPGATSERLVREHLDSLGRCGDREYGVVLMGHNDLNMQFPTQYRRRERQVLNNIRLVVAKMREVGLKPIIILPHLFRRDDRRNSGYVRKAHVKRLVDAVRSEFSSELMIETPPSTRLHPTIRGYQSMLHQVRSVIYQDRARNIEGGES